MMSKKKDINLFYSLPDEIMHIIYKKVFSMTVLEELKNKPGFFYFVNDPKWETILRRDYRIINKLGPCAWNFIKQYNDFIWEANRLDPMYKIILHNIDLSDSSHDGYTFNKSMYHMAMIAKHGWKKYKKFF
jgi:hypothetical protein